MKRRLFQLLWIALLKDTILCEDIRRPIWNIAHMVNSIKQIKGFLDNGANSLEFDVNFGSNGISKKTYHGVPCDCFRICTYTEKIEEYIEHLRALTTPGDEYFREELVLLFFDLKISGLTGKTLKIAGKDIATKLLDHYWKRGKSGARAYILLSMPSVFQMDLVKSFLKTIEGAGLLDLYKEKIGFDFSGNEDLDIIEKVLSEAEVSGQIWQGDGITNCLPRNTRRLIEAISRRDDMQSKYVEKVYWWTVDRMDTMRRTLTLGVDGMITNYPKKLLEVLNEDEFSEVARLATIDDNPWQRYPSSTKSYLTAKEGNYTFEDEILYNS